MIKNVRMNHPAITLAAEDYAGIMSEVRVVSNWPERGVDFIDVFDPLSNPDIAAPFLYEFAAQAALIVGNLPTMRRVQNEIAPHGYAGIEARGFIFAAAAATCNSAALIPIRKHGKTPPPTFKYTSEDSAEYGGGRNLEIPARPSYQQLPVLLIDDILATGTSALAAVRLLRQAGCHVIGALFLMELGNLNGKSKLAEADVVTKSLFTVEN